MSGAVPGFGVAADIGEPVTDYVGGPLVIAPVEQPAPQPRKLAPILPAGMRVAGPADETALFDFLIALNKDNSLGVPIAPKRVRAAIEEGTRGRGAIIGVIDDEGGGIAASIALRMQQFWYSDVWFLQEGWLFVRPECRKRAHHYRSLFAFAEYCRLTFELEGSQRVVVVTSVWSYKRLPLKLRLWARFGRQVGGIFMMGEP